MAHQHQHELRLQQLKLEEQKLDVLKQAVTSTENVSTEGSRANAQASRANIDASRTAAASVAVSKQVVEAVTKMNGPAMVRLASSLFVLLSHDCLETIATDVF